MPLSDWLQNESWFDIKLLVDTFGSDTRKGLSADGYSNAIKKVLLELGIPPIKLKHLGRNLGARILEMLEEEQQWIQSLGNWDPSMQESCYSTKLPMQPIRKLADFTESNGLHFNLRTMVMPTDALRRKTVFGKWCYDALNYVEARLEMSSCWTAYNFLSFMCKLNDVLLQDAAAMMVLHPERTSHPFFSPLAELHSAEFKV
jgi:hypothetical protein